MNSTCTAPKYCSQDDSAFKPKNKEDPSSDPFDKDEAGAGFELGWCRMVREKEARARVGYGRLMMHTCKERHRQGSPSQYRITYQCNHIIMLACRTVQDANMYRVSVC